jgi:CRP/FNR family transcriptional regulator, cyclic AMP receptor protein
VTHDHALQGPLSVLDSADQAALFDVARARSYEAGDVIVRQGARTRDVHVLLGGRAAVVRTTPEGREVLLALRGPGDTLGELAAFDPAPRLATVTALEPVRSLAIAGQQFVDFLTERPHAMLAMLRLLARRNRESDRRLVDTRAQEALTRLSRHLLELGARYGIASADGLELDVPLSQQQLAAWVGVSREAVSAGLRRLREQGAVATGRMRITLLDIDRLRDIAAGSR